MLLKSLRLQDFRQFNGEQVVSFSTHKDRNVTIMMGENGSGKTSFAQAFRWCLYGDTDFKDTKLLSRKVAASLLPGDERNVEVAVELTHDDIEYTVIRRQKYKMNNAGDVLPNGACKFTIQIKDKDGNVKFIPELEADSKMKEILPADLSRYFFFDGERIEKMSKEIHSGRSRDIAEAVRSLLGLNSYVEALRHLKENGINSVIRSYANSYSCDANSEMQQLKDEIDACTDRINAIDIRLKQIDASKNIDQDKIYELRDLILQNQSTVELQKERLSLQQKLKDLDADRNAKIKLFLGYFNTERVGNYFSLALMKDALTQLKDAEKLDKGIPDIHARTIDYLIKRGVCICGNKIEVGDEHYNELNKLRDFIPPKSIGTLISDFTTMCEQKAGSTSNFIEEIKDKFRFIVSYDDTRGELEIREKNISEKLKNSKDVGKLQQECLSYEQDLKRLEDELATLNQEKGQKENDKSKAETRLHGLVSSNEKNKEIERYKTYAEYVYDMLKDEYTRKEDETRVELARTINEIFKQIYAGGFSLSLDKKYNVELTADGYTTAAGDDIETSTAQSISIIFAFIAGVIEMNKKNQSASSEAYPLVMDAPLSAFDKKRIGTVCDVLPKIAEQVIIFIKDTDGDLAEKNLGVRIGKRYKFSKIDEFETTIME